VNIAEVVENVTVNGLVLRAMGHDFFGANSMSFAIFDTIYELVLKDMLSPFADMIADRTIDPADEKADSMFNATDFKDMGRKLPFVFLGSELVRRFVYKKKFFSDGWLNLASQATALYSTNLLDRNIRYDDTKGYQYP
jgi:hypothetical protein